jgi:TonB family protein
MPRYTRLRFGPRLLFVLYLFFVPGVVNSQSPSSTLTSLQESSLNSLASHAAQRIQEANLEDKTPKVLVIDFFRSSPGGSSRLGTMFADRFSESLSAYSKGLEILDRKVLRDYLTQNWTTLEDLKSNEICLQIGRQLGATGVILGTLYEENGQMSLSVHLEGFGAIAKDRDGFSMRGESTRFPVTDEIHATLFQPGPNYARTADDIPDEPGVVRLGPNGAQDVTPPKCINCPTPDYSNSARAAKFQGTVLLSVAVTPEGQAKSVYVLKGAPFGLTTMAIEEIQRWRFEPALREGKPISVRLNIETTFRLF